jgi:hypothetical protein
VYEAVLPKYEGSIANNNGRMDGKQAHSIAMLTSIAENMAALELS